MLFVILCATLSWLMFCLMTHVCLYVISANLLGILIRYTVQHVNIKHSSKQVVTHILLKRYTQLHRDLRLRD